MTRTRYVAIVIVLVGCLGLVPNSLSQELATPQSFASAAVADESEDDEDDEFLADESEADDSDEGDDLSATLEESEEEGFETEPVGPPDEPSAGANDKKPPVNPCTLSHKSVFYDNDFSYLKDPEYHGHCLGDCWKLMPVGNCGQYGTLDIGGQTRLRYHHEVGMGQDISGPGVLPLRRHGTRHPALAGAALRQLEGRARAPASMSKASSPK